MSRITGTVVTAVLAVAVATAAQAQIDSPPPALQGEASFHLYSVPGVIDAFGLGTFFACTNTTGAPVRVGVELFGSGGGGPANDASATSLSVNPSGSVLFETSGALGLPVDGSLGVGGIGNGSARILATAKKGIICGAFVADQDNAPPTSMTTLMVVAKLKQRGD